MAEGVLLGLLLAIASVGYHTWRTGISPVPTTPGVRRTLLELLPPHCEGPVVELGSGWGGLAYALGRRYPLSQVEAYELSPLPWLVATVRHLATDAPNVQFHRRDFYHTPLHEARVVVCYLYPGGMDRLRGKFERELGQGAVVVSNFFPVPGWHPVEVRLAADLEASPVYLYRVPECFDRET